MRVFACLAVATSIAACLPAVAQAKVRISVDLVSQTMHVEAEGKTFDWKVSSGGAGYETPSGSYGVLWTDKDHKSDESDGAPMPNAICFKPGFAIHGAYKSNWGHPASHGCVRLPVAKSAILWDLVKAEGGADITISGETPETRVADRPVASQPREARSAPDGADDYYSYDRPARPVRGYADDPAYGYAEPAQPAYRQAPAPGGFFGSYY